MSELIKISELTLGTPDETDVIPFVDVSANATKKALRSTLKGEQGEKGDDGTSFQIKGQLDNVGQLPTTGNETGDGYFVGETKILYYWDINDTWVNYGSLQGVIGPQGKQGNQGDPGLDGTDGDSAYVYIAYASDSDGTDFTTTFNADLNYIAILSTDTEIASQQASDFDGLWKNYKGVAGTNGSNGTSFIWESAYVAETTYAPNDVVSYNGSSYICILESTGNLPTNTTYWSLMAQKGADGEGAGDMLASVYDPTSIEGDAFDMDNMAQGTTNKFVSAAELTVLQATSGTNTGDQESSDFDIKDLTDSTSLRSTWSGKQDALTFGIANTNAVKIDSADVADDEFARFTANGLESRSASEVKGDIGLDTDDSPQFAGIELGHASDTTLSRSSAGVLAVEGVVIPSISSTNTLTNKRITPRITSITSNANPTINTDNCDCVTITAQAEAIASMTTNLSGTPTNFQKLIIRIKDNGTARAITWGSSFEAKGVALPTTTTLGKVLTTGFIYDSVTSKWGCVASVVES